MENLFQDPSAYKIRSACNVISYLNARGEKLELGSFYEQNKCIVARPSRSEVFYRTESFKTPKENYKNLSRAFHGSFPKDKASRSTRGDGSIRPFKNNKATITSGIFGMQ